ncbi:VOC family protein [Actinomadura sp. ATCC 39365]|uniref:VOC family protein n=1 Tax=Nonomuraea sp. NPDC005692 TaxID=3157168 RepID=UPI003400296E
MNVVSSTVVFTVDDLASSSRFFTTHLGFRETLGTPDLVWLSRDDAAADILLHRRDLEQPRQASAQPVVAFTVTGLAREYERLRSEGAPVAGPPRRTPWGEWLVRLTDPNGIVVELTEWITPSGA